MDLYSYLINKILNGNSSSGDNDFSYEETIVDDILKYNIEEE